MTPQQTLECAEEIVRKIRTLTEKILGNPHAQKPPPGAISKEVAAIIDSHMKKSSGKAAAKPAAKSPEPNEALTPEQIYEKPAQENSLLASIKNQVELADRPWRVGALADSLKSTKEAVTAAINAPGSGLTVVKPGWVKRA